MIGQFFCRMLLAVRLAQNVKRFACCLNATEELILKNLDTFTVHFQILYKVTNGTGKQRVVSIVDCLRFVL